MPVGAAIGRLERAAAGHGEVEVRRVARVDQDRVQLAAVGGLVLVAADPAVLLGVIVEAGDRRPGDAAVVAAEQALGRGAGVPGAGLAGVARGQPEHVVDGAAARLAPGELRRGRGLLPGGAAVAAAEHGGAEVPLARRAQKAPAIARIEDHVVALLAEKGRALQRPGAAVVGGRDPEPLAGGDVQLDGHGRAQPTHGCATRPGARHAGAGIAGVCRSAAAVCGIAARVAIRAAVPAGPP